MSAGQSISISITHGENTWYGKQIEGLDSCQLAKLNYKLVKSVVQFISVYVRVDGETLKVLIALLCCNFLFIAPLDQKFR